MWYIRAMEYYLIFKKNEILIHAPILMNFENIMLREISQPRKNIARFHLYKISEQVNSQKYQGDTTAHLLEQLKQKTLTTPNADEVRDQWELSFIAGGSTKWYKPLWDIF